MKPDQMIKRRGKLGLIKVKCGLSQGREWIKEKAAQLTKIGNTQGYLKRFIIEPFVAHSNEEGTVLLAHAIKN